LDEALADIETEVSKTEKGLIGSLTSEQGKGWAVVQGIGSPRQDAATREVSLAASEDSAAAPD